MSGATFEMSQYDPSRTYLQDTLNPLPREVSVQVEMPISESNRLMEGKQQSQCDLNEEQQAKGMLEHYLQSATIHGISQTSGPKHYSLRRPIWFILLAVMTISLVWTVYGQINNFYEYPIKTVTQVTLNTVLPFPAVTICNLNQFMRDRVPDIPIVVKVIQYQSEYFQLATRMKNQSDNMFDLENLTDVSGEELQKILFDAAPRLDELFGDCSWQGQRYDCNDLFKTDVTGHGICYTFNGPDLKPEQRYKAVGPISLLRTKVNLENNRSYYARSPHAGIKTGRVTVGLPLRCLVCVGKETKRFSTCCSNVGKWLLHVRQDGHDAPELYVCRQDKVTMSACYPARHDTASPIRRLEHSTRGGSFYGTVKIR
ncbi:acid-sensing ion channel 1, partial [Plakobranchus ocellatus]